MSFAYSSVMENHAPPYPVQSVDHVLQLLLMLKRDGVLRVSDAAAELGVAKSTAHRLISMLRFRGFVEQASDRTQRGGPDAATAAAAVALPTVRFTRGKIAELRPALTETVEGIRSDIIGLAAPKRRSGAGA